MSLSPTQALAVAMDPTLILEAQGLKADPWQREFLMCQDRSIMLLCCRGAGKSRVTSAKAVHTALFTPKSKTLIVARAERQATEVLRYCKEGFRALNWPIGCVKENEHEIELANGSRILALPAKEETIRVYHGVNLLVKDEAARIPDDLNRAVTPMVSISKGQEVDLSTPFGRRGWFYRKWQDEAAKTTRFRIPWQRCPRHTAEFIEKERHEHGEAWVAQEFECEFEAMEGLVYPDFVKCMWDVLSFARGRRVGGIDFGWKNPFAAIWGALDSNDVLWIVGERYLRQTGLHLHRDFLKSLGPITWYADPAGATERAELRSADITVIKGSNNIKAGIAAVNARITSMAPDGGPRLRVSRLNCPNLCAEAMLYRYPNESERKIAGENPIDDNNHALGALRYLVSRIDHRFMARLRNSSTDMPLSEEEEGEVKARVGEREREAIRSVWDDVDPNIWEVIE